MAKLQEHIDLITEALQAYKPTDDFHVDSNVILGTMNMITAALLRQMKGKIDTGMYQIVDCLLIEEEVKACSLNGYEVKAEPRYKVVLPTLVKDMAPDDIRYLGGSDLRSGGTRMSISALQFNEYSKFTKMFFNYTIIDNIAYLTNHPHNENKEEKMLTGILLLDNPVTACNWNDNSNYPCPSDYRLEVLTIQHILSSYNIFPDEYNDAREQLRTIGKQQQKPQTIEDEQ